MELHQLLLTEALVLTTNENGFIKKKNTNTLGTDTKYMHTKKNTHTHHRHIILECKRPHSIKDIIVVKLDLHNTLVPIKL